MSIAVPVKVWHGAQDRFVPYSHGRWLAEYIPGAEADLDDADGHMTVASDASATSTNGWPATSSDPGCPKL